MPTQAFNDNWERLQHSSQRLLRPLWQRLAAVPGRRWQLLLMVLLSAAVLADLARLVWLAVPQRTQAAAPVVTPINAPTAAINKSAGAVDIEKMAGWHLFGEVGAQPHAAAAIEEQAQDTTLNLQLLGVISASEPAQARAFIEAEGRQQQFAIGEQLPGAGKVVLNKVLVDRAIIDNNGHYETLWLYDPNSATQQQLQQSTAAAPSSTVDMRGNQNITQLAQGYRNQLYQNPGSLADIIQVAPATEGGKLIGYRVNPGRDQAQFAKFGLKPGDIVTMINDVKLDDPQRALELYNLLRSQREAAITVHRGNEDVVLMVSLENTGNAD
ncbi:MAG TPA: type II secretion system protein GspC [Spongiibacteraceae bacterium]